MIVRIVQMHFRSDAVTQFKELFAQYKDQIRQQHGCSYLELYQDKDDPNVFFTYSHWQDEQVLNNYRHSALFKQVWPATKKLFSQPPKANSLHKIHSLI